MVRNFHILNRRPFWPTRSCRKKMEPGESILISAARSRNKGEPSANSTDESTTSQNRLAHSWPIQRELLLTEANSTPSISSYPTPESDGQCARSRKSEPALYRTPSNAAFEPADTSDFFGRTERGEPGSG